MFWSAEQFTVGAISGKPVQVGQVARRQFDAILLGLQSLMIDTASAGMNVQKTAGDGGCMHIPLSIDFLFKATGSAALADLFPIFCGWHVQTLLMF
jgi:hypothetical protein